MMRGLTWACFVLVMLSSSWAWAHDLGVTDTIVKVGHTMAKVTFTAPNDHFDTLGPAPEAILPRLAAGLRLENVDAAGVASLCKPQRHVFADLERIQARQVTLLMDCGAVLQTLRLSYTLFDEDPSHKNIVKVQIARRHKSDTLSTQRPSMEIPVAKALSAWRLTLRDEPLLFEGDVIPPKPTLSQDSLRAAWPYLPLGIEHVLFGLDHVLFLLALLLLPASMRQVVALVTTFTLAHSITLALATLDLFAMPASVVEPIIALSIVVVGVENIFTLREATSETLTRSSAHRRRVAVTFAFGLIHGLGFSFVLKEIGRGSAELATLLAFNVGVELGQLAIVVAFVPLLAVVGKSLGLRRVCITASAAVSACGLFWLIERTLW